MEVRNAYNYDRDAASLESGLTCKDKSLTQQNQAKEADINFIVRQFGLTGELPPAGRRPLLVQDVEEPMEFRDVLEAVRLGDEAFLQLPEWVRHHFNDSPLEFLQFAEDPANVDKLIRMGLAELKAAPPAASAAAETSAPPEGKAPAHAPT